jgi:putative transposase
VILGQRHFDYLVAGWLKHYHEERPHQSLDNEPPEKRKRPGRLKQHSRPLDEQVFALCEVHCSRRLGGLPKSYSRRTA